MHRRGQLPLRYQERTTADQTEVGRTLRLCSNTPLRPCRGIRLFGFNAYWLKKCNILHDRDVQGCFYRTFVTYLRRQNNASQMFHYSLGYLEACKEINCGDVCAVWYILRSLKWIQNFKVIVLIIFISERGRSIHQQNTPLLGSVQFPVRADGRTPSSSVPLFLFLWLAPENGTSQMHLHTRTRRPQRCRPRPHANWDVSQPQPRLKSASPEMEVVVPRSDNDDPFEW